MEIIIIIIAIAIILICRELVCYYFKINMLVKLMEKQNELLSQLVNKNEATAINQGEAPEPTE